MKIIIRTLQGNQKEYEISPDMTVDQLKAKLSEDYKADVASQKLICQGRVMSEGYKKLADYGIKDKDFIVLMLSKVSVV